MTLIALLAIVFLLNFPFGYWRANTDRFSRGWFLAVHLPIPLLALARWELGFGWQVLPLTVLTFTLGQFLGGQSRVFLGKQIECSSCLVMDGWRARDRFFPVRRQD